jgi:hypothetical protein
MPRLSALLLVQFCVFSIVPAIAVAQASAPTPVGPRLELARAYYLAAPATYDSAFSLQAAERKSAALAGIMSWFIPGLGSFYAGNSGHGIRHIVIHIVALGAFIGGVVSTADAATGTGINVDEERDTWLILGGAGVMFLNSIWSIITAVGDANAYNQRSGGARPGRVVGSLYLDPSMRALGSNGLRAAGLQEQAGTGIQVLSVRF